MAPRQAQRRGMAASKARNALGDPHVPRASKRQDRRHKLWAGTVARPIRHGRQTTCVALSLC